jgi:hypothetical protein
MFNVVLLHSIIHKFPIIQNSQLRIYSDIQQQRTIMRNVTKYSYIRLVKTFMTNNRQTCPPVLSDWRGTHKSRELTVIYLIDFILLSHLQLIRPLYELFLEIIKAH